MPKRSTLKQSLVDMINTEITVIDGLKKNTAATMYTSRKYTEEERQAFLDGQESAFATVLSMIFDTDKPLK